jgi:hypothetical protein
MKLPLFRQMEGSGYHHVEHDKPHSKNQILHVFTHLLSVDQNDDDENINNNRI